jgi:adenine-specific DNA methylase
MTPISAVAGSPRTMTDAESGNVRSFMEVQFPVSKLSKESYKERKATNGQTLTGLGKWWGRKPLVLCRATILGLLMPASDDPQRDREVFLKLMTMDDEGLWQRKSQAITLADLFDLLPDDIRSRLFASGPDSSRPTWAKGVSKAQKEEAQKLAFSFLSYHEKLGYCRRPEEIVGPSPEAWKEINAHLDTKAKNFPELIAELGRRRFGHVPRVGDAFCGGGSVPFEAARLGCDAYGSDLNPVAALLTWAALKIVGGGPEVAEAVRKAQRDVYKAADRQVTEWGIEHNEQGWRADAYLYCTEVCCPECGWLVPLAPSWVVSKRHNAVARLIPDSVARRFRIEIESGVTGTSMEPARQAGTVRDSTLVCPNPDCRKSTPVRAIRGDRGDDSSLRLWDTTDIVPGTDDVFQERLYCIRWVEHRIGEDGRVEDIYHFQGPTTSDFEREETTLSLLRNRFGRWQAKGVIPSRRIEPGEKTSEPIRTRGWVYWHQLFTPRQLLTLGLLAEASIGFRGTREMQVGLMLGLSRCADYNSRLSRWHPRVGREDIIENTFSNQALITLYNYAASSMHGLSTTFEMDVPSTTPIGGGHANHRAQPIDARSADRTCDYWITDPPYADAINYHELSEFFLAWHGKRIEAQIGDWFSDSKRALAIKGTDHSFRGAMVECYRNLAIHMPDDGMQVVMFTHQDAAVWADLALILWAAGLRVTAAWCIQTETESDLKQGNYVQGTVLLVLRKQTATATRFLDEVYQDVEVEVRRQLDAMLALDDKEDPNFDDPDYQLAAYAAALRVLTDRPIEEIDVARELSRARPPGEPSPIVELIENAVRIACDHLIPRGLDKHLWKSLSGIERFYLKGLELESHGESRVGAYQDLARGFRAGDYDKLLASNKANEARLKTAGEFGRRDLGTAGFGSTLVRHCLFAAHQSRESEDPRDGLTWLKDRDNVPDYWGSRERIVKILNYLASLSHVSTVPHWHADARAAGLLAGAVHNDHV